jgi:Sec-independent protein secretion pathway component TatC
MVVALSSVAATLGLAGVFFVFFPLLVNGLLMFTAGQVVAEKAANDEYRATHRVPGTGAPRVD